LFTAYQKSTKKEDFISSIRTSDSNFKDAADSIICY